MRVAVRPRALLGAVAMALLTLGSPAAAQPPALSEVPAGIAEPARAALIRQRAELVEQRTAITARVRAHNDRCADVAEGSALEAPCAASQQQLDAAIAGYRAAVESFNRAVATTPRTRP